MKKYVTSLILILYYFPLLATHIVGGSLSCKHLGNNDYQIRLEVLRDCYNGSPNAYFDNPAKIGIFDAGNNLLDSLYIPFNQVDDTISVVALNSICEFPSNICVHRTIYEDTINLPVIPGGYTLAYQRCCRSAVIANLINPLDIGMTFHTRIDPAIPNSSPEFVSNFPYAVFVNTPFIYNASAVDADGDSLVYELTYPFSGATVSIPEPSTPSPPPFDSVQFSNPPYSVSNMLGGDYPLEIDPVTGQMVAIPPNVGSFQIAYLVKEFRNGVHIGTTFREFNFIVIYAISGLNYNVSGQVLLEDSTNLDTGIVELFELDLNVDTLVQYDEDIVNTNEGYAFWDIPAGVFFLHAEPDSSSAYFEQYLPTYYPSTPLWYESDPINQCDTSELYRDIHLIHVDGSTGELQIDGTVVFAENEELPVPDLPLLLKSAEDGFIRFNITDQNGYFRFEDLSEGNYSIYVDLINSSYYNITTPQLDLEDSETIQLYLYEDSLSLYAPEVISTVNPNGNHLGIKIFPNPVTNQLNLELSHSVRTATRFSLWNVLGQQLIEPNDATWRWIGERLVQVNLSALTPGIYFILLETEEGKTMTKLQKL